MRMQCPISVEKLLISLRCSRHSTVSVCSQRKSPKSDQVLKLDSPVTATAQPVKSPAAI